MATVKTTSTVTSSDGTRIAYDRMGSGPAVILVAGALGSRATGFNSELAALLAEKMTVYNYDRRGRNESGDTPPYSVTREVEDLDAIIDEAGGTACVYGISSGAALALESAVRLSGRIEKLALYEAPYGSPSWGSGSDSYDQKVERLLVRGQFDDALDLFMTVAGTPPDMIKNMHDAPIWPVFEGLAPTLSYDAACMNGGVVPSQRAALVEAKTLALNGGSSPDCMRTTARAICRLVPNADYKELPGQTHNVDPKVLAPVLLEFFLE